MGSKDRQNRADEIVVRRMRFEFPEDMPTVFIGGEPEESCLMLALSLLLPYLEPYLIRTMRAAKPLLRGDSLVASLEKFTAQEGQHYREHLRFNEIFRGRGFDGVRELEAELEADYQRFTRTKSLRFNLAYAEGFEAFTTALALATTEQERERWHPAARKLFSWHLLEELEHRTVAFDVYERLVGSYGYRVAVGGFAQWHLIRFTVRAMRRMRAENPALVAQYGGPAAHRDRSRRLSRKYLRDVMPRVLRTYSPWYTPHDIAMPPELAALASELQESRTRG